MRRMQSRASVEEETEGKEGAREKKGDMYTSVCAPEESSWGPAEQGQEERLSNLLFRAKADVTGGVEECLINPGGTITMSTSEGAPGMMGGRVCSGVLGYGVDMIVCCLG